MTVIVPWRGGCAYRERAWTWVQRQYRRLGITVVRADYENTLPWCKALAVMPCVRRAADDVVAIADADVWSEGIVSAMRAITCGVAMWSMPHNKVLRLTEEVTAMFLRDDAAWTRATPTYERRPYVGVPGGGVVVAHRDTLLEVPLDSRFKGWGQEDEAFGYALRTLCGEPWRAGHDLIHLWHPRQPRLSDRRGSVEGWELYKRYAMAIGDRETMRSLIQEDQCSLA